MAALAYTYVHMLERYRRFWDIMITLLNYHVLPISERYINVLDVGTGPAPSLHAVIDFYACLNRFAIENHVEELLLGKTNITVIEASKSMKTVMEQIISLLEGAMPLGRSETDFSGLDFSSRRKQLYEELLNETYGEEDEWHAYSQGEAHSIAESSYRFKMAIFSNFITEAETATSFHDEIEATFRSISPGGIAIIVGGKGDSYAKIYEHIESLASSCLLRPMSNIPQELGQGSGAEFSKSIKEMQYRVYMHIAAISGDDNLIRDSRYPDYWTPIPYPKKRHVFSIRVFRRGKWPSANMENVISK